VQLRVSAAARDRENDASSIVAQDSASIMITNEYWLGATVRAGDFTSIE
jgi:hypothetical protein